MKATIKFAHRVINPDEVSYVDLSVELAAPPATEIARPGVDVVIVIDRSGSMAGRSLDSVKAAVCDLIRQLPQIDRLGVVAFDGTVNLVLPVAHHDQATAIARVGELESGGATNLSGGWFEGRRLLAQEGRADAIRRIITLTDGHANRGVTTVGELAPHLAEARAEGISSSFIGFGAGYDEEFLAGLADAGGGDDTWCDGPDQAGTVFAAELGGLSRVAAQNLTVVLRPTSHVNELGILQDVAVSPLSDRAVSISLGDTFGDETRRVVCRFHLGSDLVEGNLDIATIEASWSDVGSDPGFHTVSYPVTVRLDRDPAVTDPDADPAVAREVTLLEATRCHREAVGRARSGDFERSAQLLEQSAELYDDAGADPAISLRLRRELQRLRDGTWTGRDTKSHYAMSRSLAARRRKEFRDESRDPEVGR